LTPGVAGAHTRSVSYSSWSLDEAGALVYARISLLDLSRLALDPRVDMGSDGPAARYLANHLGLERGGVPCEVEGAPEAVTAPEGWVRFRFRLGCHSSGADVIGSRILLAVAPSHMHFARVEGGSGVLERLLIESEPRFALPSGDTVVDRQAAGSSLRSYLELGVEHILTGWDHLAFVVALLLLARRLSEVATLVTAFTLAHSVTLGLAVLGLVQPEPVAVEALIGFSIALVAAENGWLLGGRGRAVPSTVCGGLLVLAGLGLFGVGAVSVTALLGLALFSGCHFGLLCRVERPARLRAAVAFAFGLVHGFGFAGVLAEMALPNERLVPALFGFNVGVEIGQLGVVLLTWPLLLWLSKDRVEWHRVVSEWGSAAVCGLGVFWFLSRTLG
jgi:hypothetical protein